MKVWVLAASLLATTVTTGAKAADLDLGPPPPGNRYGSAYDDPRYADMYRYPERQVPPPYAGPPLPREPVYRDDEDYDVRPGPGPRRFSYSDPRPPYQARCAPRELVRDRLVREGWSDFREGELQGDTVTLHARRPSGEPYLLTIERCTGILVNARPAYQGRPYAYGPQARRWERPYY